MSFAAIGRLIEVSDVAVKKRAKKLQILNGG